MYELKLINDGVRVNGKDYKVGHYIKAVNDKGKIKFVGRIQFRAYLDGEGYIDDQHLGFVVEDIDIPHMRRYTLIDLVNTGWKLHITKTRPKVKVKLVKGKTIYENGQ